VKVLFTGRGTSGSWQVRGIQIGQALRATVEPNAADPHGFDLAVIVKRAPEDLLQRLRRAGVPIVWDVVDSYPQPGGNDWGRDLCLNWLATEVKRIRPAAIVAATRAMAEDCERFGVPVLALPHHARPGQRLNPVRPLRTVGYEGGVKYIEGWRPVLERLCARRGWQFVVNPAQLADVDAVVAVRDQRGYAPRRWKSNVKLANAQGSGTPVICNREAGYLETARGGVLFADDENEMDVALDALDNTTRRCAAAAQLRCSAPEIDAVATTYLQWLRTLHA
jgi:hypothetical protein